MEEFTQRPVTRRCSLRREAVDLLRRARPGKQDKTKNKVRFLSLTFYDRTIHYTCEAVVKSSSPSAAGCRSRARSRRQSSSSTRLQPAGGQEQKARMVWDIALLQQEGKNNFRWFGTFPKTKFGTFPIEPRNAKTWRSRDAGTYHDTFKNNFPKRVR